MPLFRRFILGSATTYYCQLTLLATATATAAAYCVYSYSAIINRVNPPRGELSLVLTSSRWLTFDHRDLHITRSSASHRLSDSVSPRDRKTYSHTHARSHARTNQQTNVPWIVSQVESILSLKLRYVLKYHLKKIALLAVCLILGGGLVRLAAISFQLACPCH